MPIGPSARVKEGDIVAGKYRVERVIGAGGMGVVVAAQHLQLKQRVAIKFLLSGAAQTQDTMARFVREAQAAARIQSEHVARVLDVATLPDGVPYMVMEFLEGQDLAQLLAKRGPLPLDEAIGYILQACEGVAEAHAAGIIHRDLKPANLFLSERGPGRTTVKVLDFGISKAQPAASSTEGDLGLTKTSAIMGSPLYMSPEQMVSAKNVDERTDIWSLGVALFELVAGRPPFTGESITELIAAVLQNEPASLRQLRPDLPAGFVAALQGGIQKERTQRYSSIADFAAALAPFGPPHASVIAERISLMLGRPVSPAVAPSTELALAATAFAGNAPAGAPLPAPGNQAYGGDTTTKALSNETTAPSAERRSSAMGIAAPGALVVALVAGTAWWIAGRGSTSSGPGPSSSVESNGRLNTAIPDAQSANAESRPAIADSGATPVVQNSSADATPNGAPSEAASQKPQVKPRPRVDPWDRRP